MFHQLEQRDAPSHSKGQLVHVKRAVLQVLPSIQLGAYQAGRSRHPGAAYLGEGYLGEEQGTVWWMGSAHCEACS